MKLFFTHSPQPSLLTDNTPTIVDMHYRSISEEFLQKYTVSLWDTKTKEMYSEGCYRTIQHMGDNFGNNLDIIVGQTTIELIFKKKVKGFMSLFSKWVKVRTIELQFQGKHRFWEIRLYEKNKKRFNPWSKTCVVKGPGYIRAEEGMDLVPREIREIIWDIAKVLEISFKPNIIKFILDN